MRARGGGVKERAAGGVQEPPGASTDTADAGVAAERKPPSRGFWIGTGVGAPALLGFYALLSFQRLEIFKMLLASFFPLVVLIMAVLGSIVLGLATPTEAACSHVSFSGIGINCSARAAQYSDQPPITRPYTLSPTLKPLTPAPMACTTPAPSPPPSFNGPPCTTLPTMSSPRFNDEP